MRGTSSRRQFSGGTGSCRRSSLEQREQRARADAREMPVQLYRPRSRRMSSRTSSPSTRAIHPYAPGVRWWNNQYAAATDATMMSARAHALVEQSMQMRSPPSHSKEISNDDPLSCHARDGAVDGPVDARCVDRAGREPGESAGRLTVGQHAASRRAQLTASTTRASLTTWREATEPAPRSGPGCGIEKNKVS